MSDYSLVQKTVITADETDADGVSPKDFALASPVKVASAFITSSIRDVRKNIFVQRDVENFTNASAFPVTVPLGTAVDPDSSHIVMSFKDFRGTMPTMRGIYARLTGAGANIEFNAGALAVAETIDVSWEVVQNRQPRLATVRLLDANTVRLEWDGTLVAGEKIVASVEVFDIENLGDSIRELEFRTGMTLNYLGHNLMQDLIVMDKQGNLLSFRLRGFDTEVNLAAATKNIAEVQPLETGERFRTTITQDIRTDRNDRILLLKTLTDLLTPTPGVN